MIGSVRLIAVCALAVAAAGCTSGPVTPHKPPSLSDITVCVTPAVTCEGEMRSRPDQIVFARHHAVWFVPDPGGWQGWGKKHAKAVGTLWYYCKPHCRAAKDVGYEPTIAGVALSGLTPYGNGKLAYADILITGTLPLANRRFTRLVP